jgi:hypothetical protein
MSVSTFGFGVSTKDKPVGADLQVVPLKVHDRICRNDGEENRKPLNEINTQAKNQGDQQNSNPRGEGRGCGRAEHNGGGKRGRGLTTDLQLQFPD